MLHLKYISRFFISKFVPKYLARKLNLCDLKISDFGEFSFRFGECCEFREIGEFDDFTECCEFDDFT